MRIVVVSDSHLSPATPGAERNWEVALAHVERLRPDLVLHAGDISAEATDRPEDLAHARRLLDRIPAPWRAVPGNHDLGNPHPDRELVARWRCRYEAVFGPRFWQIELGGWRLVGLDSQALVDGHPDDDPAWRFTAEHLTGDRPIAVISDP
jgi:3',5'-cyclic AMP phosphodiesterase CpdA